MLSCRKHLEAFFFRRGVYSKWYPGTPEITGETPWCTGVLVKLKQTGHGKASAEAEERATVHLEDVERVTKILGCHSCYWRLHHGECVCALDGQNVLHACFVMSMASSSCIP